MGTIGLGRTLSTAVMLALAACGGGGDGSGHGGGHAGGGGGGSLPRGLAPSHYQTAEYNRSWGLGAIGAADAYALGGSGAGITVAVIDTGVDGGHVEMIGQLHPASFDVTGIGRDAYGSAHGTAVAGVIAAARNDIGAHGVAFDARVLSVRADAPGSCPSSCSFTDTAIAAATDHAVASGARVINYSLGHRGGLGSLLRAALERAADAGVLLVFAAGNDGAADISSPASFATHATAQGRAIAVGALDMDGRIATFSNRAGQAMDVYVLAPGTEILVPYAGGGFALGDGTSFAAPHVAGAAAVLFELWPHLRADQVATILFTTADDLGPAGTDAVHGRGALDLAAAVAPLGPLTLPVGTGDGTPSGPSLATSVLDLGAAFGPGPAADGLAAVAFDDIGRDYAVDLGRHVRSAGKRSSLAQVVGVERRFARHRFAAGDVAALGFALPHRHPAERRPAGGLDVLDDVAFTAWTGAGGKMVLAQGRGLDLGLAGLGAQALPVVVRGAFTSPHLALVAGGRSLRLDRDLGAGLGLGIGLARMRDRPGIAGAPGVTRDAMMVELAGRPARGAGLGLQLGLLRERGGLLGGSGGGAFAFAGDAVTRFAALAGEVDLAGFGRLVAQASLGHSRVPRSAILAETGPLTSAAFGVGVMRASVWRAGDRLALALSRPVRVESGRTRAEVAVGRDDDGRISWQSHELGLRPPGNEIDVELSYGRAFGPGRIDFHGLVQIEPDHDPNAPPVLTMGAVYRRLF